jgi:hypothetical protein
VEKTRDFKTRDFVLGQNLFNFVLQWREVQHLFCSVWKHLSRQLPMLPPCFFVSIFINLTLDLMETPLSPPEEAADGGEDDAEPMGRIFSSFS